MNCFKAAGLTGFVAVSWFLTGCGDQPQRNKSEPGIESKGSLEHKGTGNATRPAPPAPPPIQPIR